MSNLEIQENMQITMHFSLKLETGEEIDSTFDETPARFQVGDGNLPVGFEALLIGLKQGDEKEFVVTPEQSFGQPNPNNVQTFKREQFQEMQLEVGGVVAFADASQSELPGVICDFDEQEVTVDFNHPLAGRNLLFKVAILTVEPIVAIS